MRSGGREEGAGPDLSRLRESIVEDAFEGIATIGADLTVTYANPTIGRLLGRDPASVVGANIAGFVHPDDLDRALLHLTGWANWGAPAGSTTFRLRHTDGSWVTVDMTGATVSDGRDTHLAVYCRPAGDHHATDEVLRRLLGGASRAEVLEPVLDVFDWRPNDLHVAIAWVDPAVGHQVVTTGLPPTLTGAEDEPGEPWRRARATLTGVHGVTPAELDGGRRAVAEAAGRGLLWIEPVLDEGTGTAALVTIWGRADGPPPEGHQYGMAMARSYVELILRWSHQVEGLHEAAHRDPLTGVANRKALFDALYEDRAGGAVLYCDLDGFKAVNDRLGHAAGDQVLKAVADRIGECVRASDLVARVGGDEFVVVARGAAEEQADELAARIRAAVAEPIAVGEAEVRVGITVGLAHAPDGFHDATLAEADAALYRAKVSASPSPAPGESR